MAELYILGGIVCVGIGGYSVVSDRVLVDDEFMPFFWLKRTSSPLFFYVFTAGWFCTGVMLFVQGVLSLEDPSAGRIGQPGFFGW